ncbi:MAG: hypothetical protein KDF61_04015 [Rhodocyclaceae bacterium]|nr:hypothetical protein [Rhodocyclaceae bacterium]
MGLLRFLSYSANIALFCLALFLMADKGLPDRSEDVLIFALLLAAPVASIGALVLSPSAESWPTLWLKRKALEEKKRIADLGGEA